MDHHLVSDRPRCPQHPGVLMPCYKCGNPQPALEASVTTPQLEAVPDHQPEVEPYYHGNQTMLFAATKVADVPMVKLSLSGSIDLPVEDLMAYLDGATVRRGVLCAVSLSACIEETAMRWKGGDETGVIKLKAVELGRLTVSDEEWREGE